MDPPDIAMDFLQGLNIVKYGDFIEEIVNDIAKDARKKPKDVNEIFNLAVSRVKYVSGKHESDWRKFYYGRSLL